MTSCFKDQEEDEEPGSKGSFLQIFLSFPSETMQEIHNHQVWKVELGKGLTAEPWATECLLCHSAIRDIGVQEEIEE